VTPPRNCVSPMKPRSHLQRAPIPAPVEFKGQRTGSHVDVYAASDAENVTVPVYPYSHVHSPDPPSPNECAAVLEVQK